MEVQNEQPAETDGVPERTRQVFDALIMDEWPSAGSQVDFSTASTRHLGALQWEVKYDGVLLEQLDQALGSGERLQALISRTNPYRGVKFQTDLDELPEEVEDGVAVATDGAKRGRSGMALSS